MAIWLSREEPPKEPRIYNARKLMLWLLGIGFAISLIGLVQMAFGKIIISNYGLTIDKKFGQSGDLIKFEIWGAKKEDDISGFLGDDKIKFFWFKNHHIGLAAVDLNAKPEIIDFNILVIQNKKDVINTNDKNWVVFQGEYKIVSKNWPERQVSEPLELKGKKLARWLKEKTMIGNAISDSWDKLLWKESFIKPLSELIETSPFGEERISSIKIRQHKGTDYKASLGTPIRAANSGRVVLTGNFLADGKIVIIDHGFGLQSFYLHLSRINVKKGQMIKRGQIIGRVGSTGFSEGPHLHFEMRLNGKPFNPEQIFDILK